MARSLTTILTQIVISDILETVVVAKSLESLRQYRQDKMEIPLPTPLSAVCSPNRINAAVVILYKYVSLDAQQDSKLIATPTIPLKPIDIPNP